MKTTPQTSAEGNPRVYLGHDKRFSRADLERARAAFAKLKRDAGLPQ